VPAILNPKGLPLARARILIPLLLTYPSEPMTMRPISTRVNKPENDDHSILDRAREPAGAFEIGRFLSVQRTFDDQ
jgi:hypothetical protein